MRTWNVRYNQITTNDYYNYHARIIVSLPRSECKSVSKGTGKEKREIKKAEAYGQAFYPRSSLTLFLLLPSTIMYPHRFGAFFSVNLEIPKYQKLNLKTNVLETFAWFGHRKAIKIK